MSQQPGGYGGIRKTSGKKQKGKGGGSQKPMAIGAFITSIMGVGVGLIGIGLVMTVFGDLIDNTNLTPFTGLEDILTIIPTVGALGVVFGSVGGGFIAAKGGDMSMGEAIEAPLTLVVGGVLIPFIVAIAADAMANTHIGKFTGMDTVLSISVTILALGLMTLAGARLWGKKKKYLG